MIRVRIAIENQNRREYGYGQYVNGYVTDDHIFEFEAGLFASECVPFDASEDMIKQATRRVRANARRAYLREFPQ